MLDGTVSAQLARLIRTTVLCGGVARAELDRLPGLDPALLGEDLIRVPLDSAFRMWELAAATAGPTVGLLVAGTAKPGSLHVWDYLIGTAPTLTDGLRAASELRAVVTAPDIAGEVSEDGQLITVRRVDAGDIAFGPTEEFAQALLLRRAREATRQRLIPVRVTFKHRVRGSHQYLVDEFGTRNIEFGAPHTEITFRDPGPLPLGADPQVGRIMRHYAELTIASARMAPNWRDQLRAAMIDALHRDDLSLDTVAHRLAMSPRTLQRRLGDHGTRWRAEVELVRHDYATELLRDTDLPVRAVATRLGYTDARALRRAFHRWTGQSPDTFRRNQRAGRTRSI
ncbi:helix-turn-helix domain-containing protein [Nocardia cyriacigeorgica]|uniref:helix-turn-helix domain-containing protein n=2 Tax=Nocardia cyriacigeorgica TaxID=135487 RepID=UPI0035199EDA